MAVIGEKGGIEGMDMVELNSEKMGRILATYLLSLGHRKTAFVSTPLTERQSARRARVRGFCKAFEEAGYKDSVCVRSLPEEMDVLFQEVDMEYKTGYELTVQLIREIPDLTAIAGTNDMVALGIRDALLDQHYKIPDDISVLGCDDLLFSGLRGIDLTTVEHFTTKKGEDACKIVMDRIENKKHSKESGMISHIEYEPRLIIRGSTSYPKIL